ncbi:MAG: hypothetical protein AAGA46_16840 [Cyanobacteria bacterium P01_F01_bin.13]
MPKNHGSIVLKRVMRAGLLVVIRAIAPSHVGCARRNPKNPAVVYFSIRFMVRIWGCWQRWVNKGVVYRREILVGCNPTYVVGYRGGEICNGS